MVAIKDRLIGELDMARIDHSAPAWMDRIWDALEYRRRYGQEDKWHLLENMYDNIAGSGADMGPNLIQEMADALLSRLGVSDAAVGVSPSALDPQSVDSYPIVQSVDNWLMHELGIPESMRDIILHSYLWTRGILKWGYDSEWGFDAGLDVGGEDGFMGMTLSQFNKKGMAIEHGPARPGMPWVMPVLPHDFVVPWGTKRLNWAPWCAHRIIRHIDLLKDDPKYEKIGKIQPSLSQQDVVESYLKISHRSRTHSSGQQLRGTKGKPQFVELWECRSAIDRRVITLSETEVHRNSVDLLQIDGFPFSTLTFVPHPRTFWGTPQAEYLRFHQAELNDISKQASIQRRSNNWKILLREGAISTTELTKLMSAESGLFVMMEQQFDKDKDMVPLPQTNNFTLYNDADHTRGNAREAVGFSRNQLGEFDTSSRRTATETLEVKSGSNARTDFRAGRVANVYEETIRGINQMIFSFWKTPRMIRTQDGEWPSFTGAEIKAEYSYQIDFGLKKPQDLETRRTEAINAYLMLREDPQVNQVKLREYLSKRYADVEFGALFESVDRNAGVSTPVPTV